MVWPFVCVDKSVGGVDGATAEAEGSKKESVSSSIGTFLLAWKDARLAWRRYQSNFACSLPPPPIY